MKPNQPAYKLSILLLGLMFFVMSVANAKVFYSKGSSAANTRTNWTTSSTGSGGSNPTAAEFGQSGHTFIIRNGNAMTTTAIWNLSSNLQIDAGGSLTVGANNSWTLTIGGTTDISGTLTLRNTSNKIFTGNVTVNNGGVLDIQSTSLNVHFSNDLTVASGGTLKHYANYDNATCLLEIYGDLSIDGTYDYATSTPAVWMNGAGTKYIKTGSSSLWKLFLRTGDYYANGKITIDDEFFAMWNQTGGSFHTNGQIVNANYGVINNGGTIYVDGGTMTVGSTIGGMLIGRTFGGITGSLVVSSGTLITPGIYLGSDGVIAPLNVSGSCTQSGGTITTNIIAIGPSSTFTETNGVLNVNGDINTMFSTSSFLTTTGTSTVNIAGNLVNNGSYSTGSGIAALNIEGSLINNKTFTTTPTSTVTLNGGGNSVINGSATTTFNDLIINKSGSAVTVANSDKAFNVTNNLTVTTGNLVLQATDNDYTFSKNVTVATDGTLTHSVDWNSTSKMIGIGGNLNVTGIFNPTVRSHVQLNGIGAHTLQTGNNAASTLSILTLANGNFTASGTLKSNQEAWVMFGAPGSFTTNGKDVTFAGLLNNQGTITVNTGGTLTVNGGTQIDFGGGGTMNISAGTVNLNGDFIIGANGVVTCTNSPQINIKGNWSNSKTFIPASSTVSFLGAANQTIGGSVSTTFNNLVINPSSGVSVTSNSNNISILSNLTVTAGIFDLQTYTCNRTAAGGNFTLASGTLLKTAGANNFPQSFTAYSLHANSTTEYYGTVAQSVYPTTYGHLTVSKNSTKTAAGIVNIAGNLSINSSAIFAGSSYAHTIKGQWSNNVSAAAYSGGTSTFTFNGTALQTISGTAPTTFNKLTINNSSNVNISQDQTVNSTLTLTNGRLNIGTKNLTMGLSAPAVAGSPFSAAKMIVADGGGEVRKNYSATGSYLFPIGDVTGSAEYSPITLNYTAGTFAGGAYSGVKLANAKHPDNASSTDFLNRYWTVSNSGITSSSFIATGTYLPTDIAGTESTVAGAKYTGSLPWVKYSVIGSNTLTTTAITNTGTGIIVSGITNKVPVGTISGGGVSLCLGNSASLSSSVTNNGTGSISYAWSPATELNSASVSNPVATPTIDRTYSLTVIDGNGISSTAVNSSLSVTIPPSTAIEYTGSPFCYNSGATTIEFSGSTGGSYSGSASGISLNTGTGAVDLSASTPGKYTVSYNIAAAGGCPDYSSNTEIVINPNTWVGNTSTDWNTGSNWATAHENGCPDITILSGSYTPILTSEVVSLRNLIIMPGAGITLNNTSTLQISGSISNSGIFDAKNGTIELTGTSGQTLAASTFKDNALNHLIINNSSVPGVSLGGALDIYGSLTYKGSGRVLNTNDTLILKSNAANTAWVGDMTGNSINGKVTVERYNSQHKAWRLLSVPTNTNQTVKETWQEGGTGNNDNPVPGFGVQLTGPGGLAAGFDLYTATPSIKTYNPSTNKWDAIPNTTSVNIKSAEGYMVFIRGNRSSNAFSSPVSESVLRTKGTLFTGAIGPISVQPERFASIGNPYASPIDFTKITRTNGVDEMFYIWDPFVPGYYNLGGYQTMSATNNWEPVPGGTTAYPTGLSSTTIQSGQAFFVHATTVNSFLPANYEVYFNEDNKVEGSGISSFSRPQGTTGRNSRRQFFRASLYTGSSSEAVMADGNAVAFDENFSSGIDGSDALKITAAGENFDVKSNNKLLAVEGRNALAESDTIQYNMSNLKARAYQLRFAPVNMNPEGMEAYLIDGYLNSRTPISLTDSSFVNIAVTSDAKSGAADRFKVVFKRMAVLPVTLVSITANEEGGNITVNWKAENETNLSHYEIESSTDGRTFIKSGPVSARNQSSASYKWVDERVAIGNNYYRVRSVDRDGKTMLSEVVKVFIGALSAEIAVYPNPIVNGSIQIQFSKQPAGVYKIKLLNSLGQVILSKAINHDDGNSVEVSNPDQKLAKGIYQLEVLKPGGIVEVIKVVN